MTAAHKAIAILRVSSVAQGAADREGLPAQRRTVRRIAQMHGLRIIEEVELRISGARVADDPTFQRVLRRIEDPRIEALVCADLDRFLRPEDPSHYSVFRTLRDTETVLYTSSGPRDFRSDRLLMILEAEMAALERERITERTRRGREERRRQGRRAEGDGKRVGIPRAVQFDFATGEWSYVFPEAEHVREAFRLFLSGVTNFCELARRTNLPGKNPAHIMRRMLSQPLYAGIYRVDRRWRNGRPIPREAHEIYEHQVLDPPLISRRDFERAQRLLAEKKAAHTPRRRRGEGPAQYAGFLECGLCGAAVWVHTDMRGYVQYYCGRRRSGQCAAPRISHRTADPAIDAQLEARLGNHRTLREIIERSLREAEERVAEPPATLARRLTELHNQAERVKDAYQNGAFEIPELKKRLAGIQGEISLVEGLLERRSRDLAPDESIVRDLVRVFGGWGHLSRESKIRLLEDFQMRIRIHAEGPPKRRHVTVDAVVVGLLDELTLYKKMKRLGIE